MTHRTDRVFLAPSEPRCEPVGKCRQKDTCARRLAVIPPMGILTDYSLHLPLFAPFCPHFRSAGYREPVVAKKESKPWPTSA